MMEKHQHGFTTGKSCLRGGIAFCDKVFVHVDEGRALIKYTIPLLLYWYRLKILTKQHAFEKELGSVGDTNPNMSQQCVLIVYMADWHTSVTSRCIEDCHPCLSTATDTWAMLFPALGPLHSRILRTWRGCREEATSFSLGSSNWTLHFIR